MTWPISNGALADATVLQSVVWPTTVSSLPSSPVDGQECFYLADATNGVVWNLKYRAGSGSAYKWEQVGGPPMSTVQAGDITTASSTDVALTSGPSITLPLAGDYMLGLTGVIQAGASAGIANMSVYAGAALTACAITINPTVSSYWRMGSTYPVTGLAASTALTVKVHNDNAASTHYYNASIWALPVRVG